MATVAVLGGGISGLSAAYYLLKHGRSQIKKVLVFEASATLGGWIKSTKHADGAIYEHGPRTIRPTGAVGQNTLAMVEDLELSSDIIAIPREHPVAKNRLLLVNDQLHLMPGGISALFRTTPPFSRPLVFNLLKELVKKRTILTDESMFSFVERRLGKEIAQLVADPLCRGVYAGDAKEISVKALMKPMFEAEQKHGSILRGIFRVRSEQIKEKVEVTELGKRASKEHWAIWGLQNGLQTLPDALSKRLTEEGVEIHLSAPCSSLQFDVGGVKLDIKGNQKIECDHVIAALPASNLASLLNTHSELTDKLTSIHSVSTAVLTLEYQGSPNQLLKKQAFGFLVPSSQPNPILGVIFDSCCFTQQDASEDRTRLTVMMGGHSFGNLFGSPETVKQEDLLQIASETIKTLLGITGAPIRHQVLVLKNCIPQYTVGHFERVTDMRTYIEQHSLPLSLVGASYDGVGINDCIYGTKNIISEFIIKTQLMENINDQ